MKKIYLPLLLLAFALLTVSSFGQTSVFSVYPDEGGNSTSGLTNFSWSAGSTRIGRIGCRKSWGSFGSGGIRGGPKRCKAS